MRACFFRTLAAASTLTVLMLLAGMGFPGRGMAVAEGDYPLWDVRSGKPARLAGALPAIATGDIIFAGERHDNVRDHLFQLALVRGLHESGVKLAVGLEMFQHARQDALDRWVAGEMDEREFIAEFRENWGELWLYYRPIFLYCRDNRIPMVGLNVPREITRKVAREGFASLTPEEARMLPPVACDLDPAYERFLRRVLGGHGGAHGREVDPAFTRFCEAQLVWDTALAWHAVQYIKAEPGTRVVALCGSVHAWRPAAPSRVARLAGGVRTFSILPLGEGEAPKAYGPADCDWLLLPD